ncbi:MAG: hypothetical protein ACI39F_03485 [Acutalibacteraceae bacterium]
MNYLLNISFILGEVTTNAKVINNITDSIKNVIEIAQGSVAILAALCLIGVGAIMFWGGQNAKEMAKERVKIIFIAVGIIMMATTIASWAVGLFG